MELINPNCFYNPTLYPTKSVSYTGTAGTVSAYQTGVDGFIATVTSPAYVTVGPIGIVATSSNGCYVPPYTPMPFKLESSQSGSGAPWCVSAIEASTGSGGTLYVTPINKK